MDRIAQSYEILNWHSTCWSASVSMELPGQPNTQSCHLEKVEDDLEKVEDDLEKVEDDSQRKLLEKRSPWLCDLYLSSKPAFI